MEDEDVFDRNFTEHQDLFLTMWRWRLGPQITCVAMGTLTHVVI